MILQNLIQKVKRLKRVNLLIDLHFWALKPYSDIIQYHVERKTYFPTSYRFLCFALVFLTEEDADRNIEFKDKEKLKKTFNA